MKKENISIMKAVYTGIRIIVGLLFIFSGLIKVNDPMGLSYKMQEFFEVWGLSFFNDFTLSLSVIMNTFEIVAGVALLIGWRFNTISWLLLLFIIFFNFLTGYALLSGKIKTCGCFGDCIPLTAKQSFIKDIILLILILVLVIKKDVIKPLFNRFTGFIIIALTTVVCFYSQSYVLKHLPIIDCLAYKQGNNILEKMKIPEGAVSDSFAIMFKYRKDGKEVSFDMDHFPEDFNDTTYTYIDRVQELVRQGTATAPINDFFLKNEAGEDITQTILNQKGKYVMLFSKNTDEADADWSRNAKKVSEECAKNKIPFFIVTATIENAAKQLPPSQAIQYLIGDATVLKTAGRVNPTYFVMNGATIEGKYANADVERVVGDVMK